MMALAEAFAGAEKSLARSDRNAFAGSVDTIRELSKGIPGIHARGSAIDGGFLARASGLGDVALDASRRARGGDAAGAAAALEGVRDACVQCHAVHRPGNARRGMYPARGNTVAGEVSVAMLGGEEREDRSNVVVFLEGVPTPQDRVAAPRRRRITQKGAKFEPRVLPIVRGESVEFPNDDFIFHNVFSLSETRPFDLGAYGPGGSKSVAFPRTGLVRIYCNIHPQMLSTVIVLENPFFATTDEHGRFAITGVPDGTYVLRCWHEYGGEHRETVELAGAALAEVAFGIREDKVTLDHKNKFGLPYREAYR
jgi:plastocyanin